MLGLFRVFHWGPITAICIIKWISLVTLYCNLRWYPPANSFGGLAFTVTFLVLSGLTLYHFLFAMYDGPGYLPLSWKPDGATDEELLQLQFCHICQGHKAPRSHHCRKCNRCVMKMDHHCPWINNCVGHFNHGHFTAFLGSAVLGCLLSCISLTCSLYYGLNRNWYEFYGTGNEPKVVFTVWSLIATLLGLGLSIGVVIAVGLLLFFQLRAIMRNQTGIEDWILEKAVYRHRHSDNKFVYPYNLGRLNNLRQVITWTCQPKGNGIVWEVIEGADQYSLTREQLLQKADKRDRSREYEVFKSYSGACFPITHGVSVCIRPPCTDEPRIQLIKGDRIIVTRWKKYWMYGDKVVQSKKARIRGWFPRHCTVETVFSQHYDSAQLDADHNSESSDTEEISTSAGETHQQYIHHRGKNTKTATSKNKRDNQLSTRTESRKKK